MNCPACREALIVVEREGIELDWCLTCRGLWFDEGELELLAQKSGRRLEPGDVGRPLSAPAQARRRCPRCRRRMNQVAVGGRAPVTADRCAIHGIWLDHGELGSIMGQLAPSDDDEQVIMEFLGETFRSHVAAPRTTGADDEPRSRDA